MIEIDGSRLMSSDSSPSSSRGHELGAQRRAATTPSPSSASAATASVGRGRASARVEQRGRSRAAPGRSTPVLGVVRVLGATGSTYAASAGNAVSENSSAPPSASATVIAIGLNIRPSTPSSAISGR